MKFDKKLTITLTMDEVNNLFNILGENYKYSQQDEQFKLMLEKELREFLGMDKSNPYSTNTIDEIPF